MGEDKLYKGNLLDKSGVTEKWVKEYKPYLERQLKRVATAVKEPFEKKPDIEEKTQKRHTTSSVPDYSGAEAFADTGLSVSTAKIKDKEEKK